MKLFVQASAERAAYSGFVFHCFKKGHALLKSKTIFLGRSESENKAPKLYRYSPGSFRSNEEDYFTGV
jgi:hypothetical protein